MTRNIGDTSCYYCGSELTLEESARPITQAEAGAYWPEFCAMLVANAHCPACCARYLAWMTKPWRPDGAEVRVQDLSFRSSFDDEPDVDDLPLYRVETRRVRVRKLTEYDHVVRWRFEMSRRDDDYGRGLRESLQKWCERRDAAELAKEAPALITSRERDYFRDVLRRIKSELDRALQAPEGTEPP